MKVFNKFALTSIAASGLLAIAVSSSAVAAPKNIVSTPVTTTTKSPLPNGKPFQYLNSRIDSLEAQLNLLIGRVSSLEDWQVRAQLALEKLQLDTVKNAAAIAVLQAQIDDVKAILATKQDIINQVCPDHQVAAGFTHELGLICTSDVGTNGLTVFTAENFADVAPSTTVDVSVGCPAGSVATANSYNASPELTVNSTSITPAAYTVNVTNATGLILPITVSATCLGIKP